MIIVLQRQWVNTRIDSKRLAYSDAVSVSYFLVETNRLFNVISVTSQVFLDVFKFLLIVWITSIRLLVGFLALLFVAVIHFGERLVASSTKAKLSFEARSVFAAEFIQKAVGLVDMLVDLISCILWWGLRWLQDPFTNAQRLDLSRALFLTELDAWMTIWWAEFWIWSTKSCATSSSLEFLKNLKQKWFLFVYIFRIETTFFCQIISGSWWFGI